MNTPYVDNDLDNKKAKKFVQWLEANKFILPRSMTILEAMGIFERKLAADEAKHATKQ